MAAGAIGSVAVMAAGVIRGATCASGGVRPNANSWPGIVSSISGAMSSSGFAAGYAAGMGAVRRLNSALGQVRAAAGAIAAEVAVAMATKLLISSPSRVIRALMAKGIGPGAVQGIEAGIPAVARASEKLANTIMRDVNVTALQSKLGEISRAGDIWGR